MVGFHRVKPHESYICLSIDFLLHDTRRTVPDHGTSGSGVGSTQGDNSVTKFLEKHFVEAVICLYMWPKNINNTCLFPQEQSQGWAFGDQKHLERRSFAEQYALWIRASPMWFLQLRVVKAESHKMEEQKTYTLFLPFITNFSNRYSLIRRMFSVLTEPVCCHLLGVQITGWY